MRNISPSQQNTPSPYLICRKKKGSQSRQGETDGAGRDWRYGIPASPFSCQLKQAGSGEVAKRNPLHVFPYREAGRGGDGESIVLRADVHRYAPFLPARYRTGRMPLLASGRYRHAIRVGGSTGRSDKQDDGQDEERDELMERPQVQEKRAGCRHPVSRSACSA